MDERRIDKAFEGCPRLAVTNASKLVIMSDCHRGLGDAADDFADNQHLWFTAMSRYFESGFTYIELGDGDELWENSRFAAIAREYDHVFWLLRRFYLDGRLYMLYGNHDMAKRGARWRDKNFADYINHNGKRLPLFGTMPVHEGLVLRHQESKRELYLLHGHQADFFNDRLWRLSKFLVRHVWRPLQMLGIRDPTRTARDPDRMELVERLLMRWAQERDAAVVAGHTHRTAFPEPGKPAYYNDGSCVHPRCVTALELEQGALSLVKWSVNTRPDGTLYVGKTLLEGPRGLGE